ncbi:MAG: hypothetical protein ACREJ9_09460, partial [Candidatus Rokuibacteriota bacterium]
PAAEVWPRVEHHLRAVAELAGHFDAVMQRACPRFATTAEWRTYVNGEVDRVVLLAAHLEQAWIEAKATADDTVRRAAKAPRERLDEARALTGKLATCARAHGTTLELASLWREVERQVPRRQAEIRLPP